MTRGIVEQRVVSLGALAMVAILAASARADVRYTTQMAFGDGAGSAGTRADDSAAGPLMRMTTFVKDNNERVETTMQMGPIQTKTVMLTLCGKRQTIQLDPDLKIYTIKPMSAGSMLPGAGMNAGARPGAARNAAKTARADGPATGKVVMTYTVQDLGREKLVNLDTRHVMVTMRSQSSGCIGNGDTTTKMEVWMAPIKTLNCPDRFTAGASGGDGSADGGDCKVAYEMKGDVEKMKDLFSGMVVQQKLYQGNKVTMTQTLREHSLATLDPALFAVPADYKKVSEAEFTQAQQKAMMRGMGSPDGAAPDGKVEARPVQPDMDNAEEPAPADEPKPEEKPKKKRIKIPGLPF